MTHSSKKQTQIDLVSSEVIGKTIAEVELVNGNPAFILNDGTHIVVQADAEGNGPGCAVICTPKNLVYYTGEYNG